MSSSGGPKLIKINRLGSNLCLASKCLLRTGWFTLLATWLSITAANCLIASENSIVNSYPIIYEDGQDNYLLLSDDELVKNAEILRYLSSSTKEEVEEIVDGNPLIQNQLLDRVTKIVRQRQKNKSVNKPKQQTQVITGSPDVKGPVPVYSQPVAQYYDEYDDGKKGDKGDKEEKEDKEDKRHKDNKRYPSKYDRRVKLLLLKAKLKKKAIKWFKIGSKLKNKLVLMAKKNSKNNNNGGLFRIASHANEDDYEEEEYEDKEKNDRKTKARTSRPRFRFRISTSG